MAKTQIPTGGLEDDAVTTAKATGFGKLGQVVYAVFDVDTDVGSSTFADLTDGSGETLEVAITG